MRVVANFIIPKEMANETFNEWNERKVDFRRSTGISGLKLKILWKIPSEKMARKKNRNVNKAISYDKRSHKSIPTIIRHIFSGFHCCFSSDILLFCLSLAWSFELCYNGFYANEREVVQSV
jgi:hypothetical protein